ARGDQHLAADGARRRAPGTHHGGPRQTFPLAQPGVREVEHRLAISAASTAAAHVTAGPFSCHHRLSTRASRRTRSGVPQRPPMFARRRAKLPYYRTLRPPLEASMAFASRSQSARARSERALAARRFSRVL